MSLNLSRLEKIRDSCGGKVARCPACAESGQDGKGEHLRIYPDGKFGCCVHPGDREHRKRIYALVGERGQRTGISVRVTSKATVPAQNGIFRKIQPTNEIRTPRTAVLESNDDSLELFRTPRTPPLLLTRIAKEIEKTENEIVDKESEEGVRSVRVLADGHNPPKERLPHFTSGGTLMIPFDSPERYYWWRGGQLLKATHTELLERKENNESEF